MIQHVYVESTLQCLIAMNIDRLRSCPVMSETHGLTIKTLFQDGRGATDDVKIGTAAAAAAAADAAAAALVVIIPQLLPCCIASIPMMQI